VIVLLDSAPVWMVVSPRPTAENLRCKEWLAALAASRVSLMLPEVIDYEVRRETLRAGNSRALQALEELTRLIEYVALTTQAMRLAAAFWAEARRIGRRTADDRALDVDVILAAQAVVLSGRGEEVLIATTNPQHLAQFTPARLWSEVTAVSG
jgi:predicted nucleic acid-binding protein